MTSNKKNMKAIGVILAVALILVSLTACGGETSGKKIVPADVYSKISETVAMPEMMEVPSGIILDYYGIKAEDYSDAIFYMCMDSLLADEVVIVNAVDADAATRIQQKLSARIKLKADAAESYSPEQYAIITRCSVRQDGLTVAMIVSPDADKMVEIYEEFLK